MAVLPSGGDQAHDRGGTLAGGFGAGEQPVLAAHGDGPDRPLDRVVVDGQRGVVDIAHERRPALAGMRERFGEAAVGRDVGGYLVDPLPERIERRSRLALSSSEAFGRIQTFDLSLDPVLPGDLTQRRFGMRAGLRRMQLEEQAADMRPAAYFGDALGKQGFVAAVVVHDEMAAERAEEALGVLAAAAGAKVEDRDRRSIRSAVREQIRACGLARAGIEQNAARPPQHRRDALCLGRQSPLARTHRGQSDALSL
jgi:hypothetical protein